MSLERQRVPTCADAARAPSSTQVPGWARRLATSDSSSAVSRRPCPTCRWGDPVAGTHEVGEPPTLHP